MDGHFEPYKFDLVKWQKCKPYTVFDANSEKEIILDENCFSIGFLDWDPISETFKFTSCGLNYLEHRIDHLEDFILTFCKLMERELKKKDEE